MRAQFLLLLAAPLAAQQPSSGALTAFDEGRALAVIRGQLPCLGCHELNGEGGHGAPSLTGVAGRRDGRYIRAIIEDPEAALPGAAMPRVPMPPETRELVVRYFTRQGRMPAAAHPVRAPARQPSRQRSPSPPAAVYQRWCASCHGKTGRGDGINAVDLPVKPAVHASAADMRKRTDDALYDAIAGGGVVMGKSSRMPAFGETLSAVEIHALVAYIRTLCSCSAPAWSRHDR